MSKQPAERLPTENDVPQHVTQRTMADVLALPDALRQLVTWMMRHDAVTLAEVAAHTGQETAAVHPMLDSLVAQGFVQLQDSAGTPHYRLCLVARRPRQAATNLWTTLGKKLDL